MDGLTLLVGPNNAGKSSVLQAIQFATSVCQSLQLDNVSRWSGDERSGTLSAEQLIYTPLRDVHALAFGGRLKQESTTAIRVELIDLALGVVDVAVSRGKNKNIAVRVNGRALGERLSDLDNPFSVVAPGLAGIPSYEEYRAQGVVRRSAARGDANSVFRNVLLTLKGDAHAWDTFQDSLQEVFHDIDIDVEFDHDTGEHIAGWVKRGDVRLPIDSCGTGVLQAIQVLSYVGVYKPRLLILDEPDSHLHPDNQRKLARLLDRLSHETELQVLLSTHSRHFLDEFGKLGGEVHWLSDGERRTEDFSLVSALLELGALDAGDRLKNGETSVVVVTEDSDTQALRTLLLSSGLAGDDFDIWSYASSSKLDAAVVLGRFIEDTAPGTKVLVHRDRDYLDDLEVQEFIDGLRAAGLHPFVTLGTDVESHFLDVDFLHQVHPEIALEELTRLLNEATADVREASEKIMINIRVERANRLRSRGDQSQPSAGTVAQEAPKDFDANPVLYRHGKKTLKRVRALIQERYGLQRSVTSTISQQLAVDEIANLVDASDEGATN